MFKMIQRVILVLLLASSFDSYAVNMLSSCMISMVQISHKCTNNIKKRKRKPGEPSAIEQCSPLVNRKFNECIKKVISDKRRRGACSRILRKKKRLKTFKGDAGLFRCFDNTVSYMRTCQKKTRFKRREKRTEMYKACYQEQAKILRACIKRNSKESLTIPPIELNIIDNIFDDCRIPDKYQVSIRYYKKRLMISKAIGKNYPVLKALEERLKQGKDNSNINDLSMLHLETFHSAKGLNTVSLQNGKVLFEFNNQILGKPFSILLKPGVDEKKEVKHWDCSVTGEVDKNGLPEVCRD